MRAAILLVAAGCATPAFNPSFGDNRPTRLNQALRRMDAGGKPPALASRPVSGEHAMIFAATKGSPSEILAYDLAAGKVRWKQPADVRSRIYVGPSAVFHREGTNTLVARSLGSGNVLWRVSLEGGRFLGMATAANTVVYVTEAEGARVEGREVARMTALDVDGGGRRWERRALGRLGAPAMLSGVVLVPFAHQYLSIVEAKDGREIARLRNREEEIEFVVPTPEGTFFGSRGLFRLDTEAAHGQASRSTHVGMRLPEEFLRTSYAGDGYNPAQAQYTAYDRNRLLWRVGADGKSFRDGQVLLHNYRFVFGMDAAKGGVLWAYAHPGQDLVASAHVGTDALLVSAAGEVVSLDVRTGAPVLRQEIGVPIAGATIDAEGFAAPRGPEVPLDLLDTLTEIIWDPDRRFEPVKLFCIAELSRLEDPRVVDALIRIITHENVVPRVHARAADTLVARVDGGAVPGLAAALAVRTDYLESTKARGVASLARAAAKVGAPELAAPLVFHLGDPETPAAALEVIIAALVELGDPVAVEPIARFLLEYRADSDLEAHPEAMRLAADGLLELGTPLHRQLLAFVEGDPLTRPFLRAYVGKALASPSEERAAAPGQADESEGSRSEPRGRDPGQDAPEPKQGESNPNQSAPAKGVPKSAPEETTPVKDAPEPRRGEGNPTEPESAKRVGEPGEGAPER